MIGKEEEVTKVVAAEKTVEEVVTVTEPAGDAASKKALKKLEAAQEKERKRLEKEAALQKE